MDPIRIDPIRLQFHGSAVSVGTFRCHPSHPSFEDTGPIRRGHMVVFPRTSVRITHVGGEPIVANPNVVMFYNRGQIYRRAPISAQGDRCEWFAFHPGTILDAVRDYHPAATEHPDRPFPFAHGPSDAASYMLQRLVVEHIFGDPQPDALWIEELLLHVLMRTVQSAFRARGDQPRPARPNTRRAHAELARTTQELIATHFDEPLILEWIARQVHSSPYRLCRIFRARTGQTIHEYQNQLRLRTALERIPDCRGDLTALALDLGYASHSHFTAAFRRAFGTVPSQLATAPTRQQLRKLSKILTA